MVLDIPAACVLLKAARLHEAHMVKQLVISSTYDGWGECAAASYKSPSSNTHLGSAVDIPMHQLELDPMYTLNILVMHVKQGQDTKSLALDRHIVTTGH